LGHFCVMDIYKQFKECAFLKLSIRNNEQPEISYNAGKVKPTSPTSGGESLACVSVCKVYHLRHGAFGTCVRFLSRFLFGFSICNAVQISVHT